MRPQGAEEAYRRGLYPAALLCGITPLTVGTCVFVSWIFLRWDVLPLVGFFTIYGGLLFVILGFVCLGMDLRLEGRKGTGRWALLRRSVLPACVLLLNFPLAGGYVVAAIAIETRYVVTVSNEASLPAESVIVQGGGVREEFGTLAPGERRTRGIWFEQDGELKIEGRVGDRRIEGLVDEYVTHGLGGRAAVQVRADGSVLVTRGRR